MYKSILFTKEANHLGRGFSEPPAVMVRPGQSKIAEIDTPLHPALQAYIQMLKPDENSTYVLVNAMGAGEWYGDNINGDYFPYEHLVNHTDQWLSIPAHDTNAKRRVAHQLGWGYTTFMNSHAFKHHVNKDPNKSYGEVVCAVWNEKMKRVELIIRLDHQLCEKNNGMDVLNKIHNGEFPDVSMGCKVPYDVCSICGNKARMKDEYCVHIRDRRMNRDPRGDGQRPYMINIRPRFFDISFVFIGADKTARTLMKIASFEEPVYKYIVDDVHRSYPQLTEMQVEKVASGLYVVGYDPYNDDQVEDLEKAASEYATEKTANRAQKISDKAMANYVRYETLSDALSGGKYRRMKRKLRQVKESGMKLADIIKYVVPNAQAKSVSRLEGGEPDLPEHVLDRLGERGLEPALNATARKGIVLKMPEFARIALVGSGLKHIADKIRGCSPAPVDDVSMPIKADLDSCGGDLDEMLDPFMGMRSCFPPMITRREVHIIMMKPKGVDGPGGQLPVADEKKELMDKISAAYNGYRLWLVSNAPELGYFEKDASVSLESAFGGGYEPVSDDSLELTSAYLEQAHWQAGGRNA